jgi:predicted ATP-grasp superfamily ATP-dependent carboligase
MKALIVGDADLRGTIASVRALARAGWTVGIGSARRGHATASRFCSAWHFVPLLGRSKEQFVHAINEAATEGGYDLAFGGGDAEVLALSTVENDLHLNIPYAGHDSVCRAMDKVELYRAAEHVGLNTPRTVVATEEAIAQVTDRVIVKPRLHWSPGQWASRSRLEAVVVHTAEEAERSVRRITDAGGTALLQEFVDGRLIAYVALMSKTSDVVAGFMQAATAMWPLQAGIFARAVTVASSEKLTTQISQLLAELGWFGITQLQFIQPPNGHPYLIDFNGRFYMSLSLPVEAGLNLPAMWASLAMDGHPSSEPLSLQAGLRYQWLELDLRRALVERRGGIMNDLVDTLSFARRATHTMCTRDDPGPAFDYLVRLCVRAIQRRKTERQKCSLGPPQNSHTNLESVRPTLRDRGA